MDSIFSFLKPAGEQGMTEHTSTTPAPLPQQPPPPPPRPRAAAPSPPPEPKPEKKAEPDGAAERRLAGLEKLALQLESELRETRSVLAAEKDAGDAGLKAVRDGLAALEQRLAEEEKQKSASQAQISQFSVMEARIEALEKKLRDQEGAAAAVREAAYASAGRLEKLEEKAARLVYLEKRLEGNDQKIVRIYECEAALDAVQVRLGELERGLSELAHKEAAVSADNKNTASEVDSLSRKMAQLSALFNQFRSELAWLGAARSGQEKGR